MDVKHYRGIHAHELGAWAQRRAGLDLLIVVGSRARGEERTDSDWDFAYQASAECDVLTALSELVSLVGSDEIDLVDLGRAGGLFRYRAARDGKIVYERLPRTFARFWLSAASFWCDNASLFSREYERIFDRMKAAP